MFVFYRGANYESVCHLKLNLQKLNKTDKLYTKHNYNFEDIF